MADINPGIDIGHCITWEWVVNNTYGWLNTQALFDRSQQAEFERQQKRHATLNDLEKATEQLYDCSIEAETQDNERRVKAEAASTQLPLERQLAHKKRQEQAKVTGIVTPSTDDTRYPHWVPQPRHKTPGSHRDLELHQHMVKTPQPYLPSVYQLWVGLVILVSGASLVAWPCQLQA